MNTPELKKERQHSHIHTHHRQKKNPTKTQNQKLYYINKRPIRQKFPMKAMRQKVYKIEFVLYWIGHLLPDTKPTIEYG